MMCETQDDFLTLKWGTLKAWKLSSKKAKPLLKRYFDIGASSSAMIQKDTPEQKEIICQLIDICGADTVCLDWDGRELSREKAKKYVMNYGKDNE